MISNENPETITWTVEDFDETVNILKAVMSSPYTDDIRQAISFFKEKFKDVDLWTTPIVVDTINNRVITYIRELVLSVIFLSFYPPSDWREFLTEIKKRVRRFQQDNRLNESFRKM